MPWGGARPTLAIENGASQQGEKPQSFFHIDVAPGEVYERIKPFIPVVKGTRPMPRQTTMDDFITPNSFAALSGSPQKMRKRRRGQAHAASADPKAAHAVSADPLEAVTTTAATTRNDSREPSNCS